MAIISKQIGWGTEANLIYELIKQTERLSAIYSNVQPKVHVPISKPLSLSTEANLYYEWLRSLSKFTAQVNDCCSTTTTSTSSTTTTTTTKIPCKCYCISNNTLTPLNLVAEECNGSELIESVILPSQSVSGCFSSITPDLGLTIEIQGICTPQQGCPECTPCLCYNIENTLPVGPENSINVNYLGCDGISHLIIVSPQQNTWVCAHLDTVVAGAGGVVTGGVASCTTDGDCAPQ